MIKKVSTKIVNFMETGNMMLLFYAIVDFYLFYDGPVNMQIWILLTINQCKIFFVKMSVITSSGWIDRSFWTERDHVGGYIKSTSESYLYEHDKQKYAAQLRPPIEKSLVLCHLKTLRLYTGPFKFELDHYLTNVARVKSTYWDWPILFINWAHDVSVPWFS